MNTTLSGNLLLFRPRGGFSFLGPRPAQAPARKGNRVLAREELLDRLEVLRELGRDAPLSYLAVQLRSPSGTARGVIQAVAERVANLLRPTDAVGLFAPDTAGVVLQATGATAAAALAARLSMHLNRALADMAPGHYVSVYAATGTGANALTLPLAAAQDLDESC